MALAMATTTTTTTSLSTADATHLNTLRTELKQWEKAFAEANGGRKAGRHDIKQDPDIAAKYKTYGRLRALEESSSNKHKDGAVIPSKSDQDNARTKRKYAVLSTDDDHHTPRKARRELSSPAKSHREASGMPHPAAIDPYDSPSVFRRLFSPTSHLQPQQLSPVPLRNAIGPTPQRNGRLLGLFDMLSASGGSAATPSAKRIAILDQAIIQTPSRSKAQRSIPEMTDEVRIEKEENGGDDDDDDQSEEVMGRTPASSSKKLYLERLFATPTTLRFATMIEEEEGDDDIERSQQIQLKAEAVTEIEKQDDQNPLGSGTPSFLRRSNPGRYIPNNTPTNNFLSPVGIRKHRRFNGKGLTALVQGLRDMEKERMEDDWDILKELEAEQEQEAAANMAGEEDIQVGDSQVPHDEADNKPDPGGKIWKKKTQKRTTRLVKMKPVIQAKSRPSRTSTTATTTTTTTNKPTKNNKGEDESEHGLDGEAHLPGHINLRVRKQAKGDTQDQGDDCDENNEDSNYENIDSDNSSDKDFTTSESARKPQQRITSSFKDKIKAAFSSIPVKDNNYTKTTTTKAGKDKENGTTSPPKRRKVNPDAHANYRSLKIRSKGQGRFGKGRFGRR